MSPQEGFHREGRSGVCVERVRPRNLDIQDHKVTSNTCIKQNINHKEDGAPMITPPLFKYSNIGSYKTVVHVCAEVPHKIPKGQSPKPNNI